MRDDDEADGVGEDDAEIEHCGEEMLMDDFLVVA